MLYLFVHQNFPGQFLHIVRHLAQDPANEILFITEPNGNSMAGVRLFTYTTPDTVLQPSDDAAEFEAALARAATVQQLCERLRSLGFRPDIIIGHHGWGELLNLSDVFPTVPILGYYEFFYRAEGLDVGFDPEFPTVPGGPARVRAKNAINLLALNNPGHGQTPTQFQSSTYPAWAQPRLTVLPEGVDLSVCRPDPKVRTVPLHLDGMTVEPDDVLVTYVARDLEPYRGFHTFMRALPRLHRLHPGLKVVLVGRDGVSYGARIVGRTWREHMLEEVGAMIDPARICFTGRVPYELFVTLLQRSDAHVYLTYPFVLSWSLREALACGCAIVASDTGPVQEFVTDGVTGLLVPFPDPGAIVAAVERLLGDKKLARRLMRNARQFAERTLQLDRYLRDYEALIRRMVAGQS